MTYENNFSFLKLCVKTYCAKDYLSKQILYEWGREKKNKYELVFNIILK